MEIWEHKLHVRRRACEFRLFEKRQSHSKMTEYRNKFELGSPARVQCDRYLAMKQREIVNVLDEIRFIKDLAAVGPIYGDHLSIAPNGSQVSISMLHLFERVKEKLKDEFTFENYEGAAVARGIALAEDILINPRNYMTEEEQKAYDLLVEKEKQEDARAERYRAPVVPPTTAKRGIPKKPGRPPGSKKRDNPADYVPQVAVKLRIVDGQAKLSSS